MRHTAKMHLISCDTKHRTVPCAHICKWRDKTKRTRVTHPRPNNIKPLFYVVLAGRALLFPIAEKVIKNAMIL